MLRNFFTSALLALSFLSWSQNSCPTLTGFLDPVNAFSDESVSVDYNLNDFISDADGDALTIDVFTTDDTIATFSLNGRNLTVVTKENEGTAFINITVGDGDPACSLITEILVVVLPSLDIPDITIEDPTNTSTDTTSENTTGNSSSDSSDTTDLGDSIEDILGSQNCPTVSAELGIYEQNTPDPLFLEFNLNDYFTDPEGKELSFTYDLIGDTVVTISQDGAILKVEGTGTAGFARVFVNASNGDVGCFTSNSLSILIIDPNDTSGQDINIEDLIPDDTTLPEEPTFPSDFPSTENCPSVIGELGSFEKTVDDAFSAEFYLNDYFSNPEGNEMTFTYDVFGDNVLDIVLEGATLKAEGNGNSGFATVFVDANNGIDGCFASISLNIFITNPNDANAPDLSLEDLLSELPDTGLGFDPNAIDFTQCPFVTTGLEPIITTPDAPKEEVFDLKFFFSDPNDKELTYTINNQNPSVASADLEGSVLKIQTLETTGESFIEIIATNGENGCETFLGVFVLVANEEEIPSLPDLESQFDFSSEIELNLCPELSNFFEPISVPLGEVQEFTFNLDDYFTDPEGDSFTYEIFNANPAVAYASLFGKTLTISLGSEYGLGFVIVNIVGGGNDCIISAEIPLEVVPGDTDLLDCPALLSSYPELSLQLDQPETSVDLSSYLNQGQNRVFSINLIGTENDYIQADLFDTTLVVSVKEIGAGNSAVYLQIKEETSGCFEIVPLYVAIEDPLGLQDTNCPNLKQEFPFVVTLEKGASISFTYADYFANIDAEGIEFIGGVAFEDMATAAIDDGVMTISTKEQAGFTPAAIGVKDAFGLCEIYVPFEIQILGAGVTENSCPEFNGGLSIIEVDQVTTEITLDLNDYFQDPDGDSLFFGGFIDSNELVDFNLIDNQLTVFLKQNVPGTAVLEIGASDGFADCFTTASFEIKTGSAEVVTSNSCPEVVGNLAAVSFGPNELLKNISIEGLFNDADGDPIEVTVSSANPELINAEVQGTTLSVFASPGKTGETVITLSAKDEDPYCQTNYTLSATIPSPEPVVQNTCPQITSGIPPIRVSRNTADKIITVNSLYTDDDPNLIAYSVNSSDQSVVDAAMNGNYLVLNFSDTQFGQANVTLKINDYGGNCVEYINFTVEIFEEIQNLPPYFDVQSFSIQENDFDENSTSYDKFLGKIAVTDPENDTINLSILNGNDDGLFELRDDELYRVGVLDYEEKQLHELEIIASDGTSTSNYTVKIFVENVANASIEKEFSLQVYDVTDESTTGKTDAYKRFLNPVYRKTRKGVGKWKVRKNITGGADADKFRIRRAQESKNDEILEDQLEFIINPDFENPADANGDNVYEVDIEIINETDGESLIPVVVSQNSIVVPENVPKALEIESIPASVLQDSDGDGIQDLLDNSPLQYNPGQEDSDGDGVGDVSDDADQDGVWDPFDICPDTPFGTTVNLEGCPIFTLPSSNFNISKSEKCIGENQITMTVEDTSQRYRLVLTGPVNRELTQRNETATFERLPGGTYELCVTVNGVDESEFKRCFSVTIAEPEPLEVYGQTTTSKQAVHFDLSGGTVYNITHNGITEQTKETSINVKLAKGLNTVRIDTGIECQGVFEQQYFNSAAVVIAPNPASDFTHVFVGGQDPQVHISVFNSLGGMLYQTKVRVPDSRKIAIPTASWPIGSYYIKVQGATTLKNLPLIKE